MFKESIYRFYFSKPFFYYKIISNVMSLSTKNSRGGFQSFGRGGVRDGERREPKIFGTLLQGGANFYRGVPTVNPYS